MTFGSYVCNASGSSSPSFAANAAHSSMPLFGSAELLSTTKTTPKKAIIAAYKAYSDVDEVTAFNASSSLVKSVPAGTFALATSANAFTALVAFSVALLNSIFSPPNKARFPSSIKASTASHIFALCSTSHRFALSTNSFGDASKFAEEGKKVGT